jgi:hypothetical protein
MDTEFVIEYEVIEPVSNTHFFTKTRDEAIEFFESGYMVYEHHNTVTQFDECKQSRTHMSLRWHLNPTFNPR